MNIDHPSQSRLCTSCQMCEAVCPTQAISIRLDKYGFYRPVVNPEKCIDCGLCVKSCYKFDDKIRISETFEDKKLYSAWAKDKEVVASTTSGGIADILVEKLISQGYKCIGIEYDADRNLAVARVATTREETVSFRGSKYIQAYTAEAFKQFVRNHKKERFAVFGLPCQIYAIDKFLRTNGNRDNHLLIDLYCHGCPSLNTWKKYIVDILKKKDCNKVISVNFRSKIRGWGHFYVVDAVVEGVNGRKKYFSPRINDHFYTLFFSDMILNGSCYDCQLRSTLEYTDIRLGDFWGNKFIRNHTGVSAISVCTEHGEKVFDSITNEIECNAQSFASFIPFQSYGKNYHCDTGTRNTLLEKLSSKDTSLKDIVETYKNSLSFKRRMIIELKNIIKFLPNSLQSSLKALFYKAN